MGHALHRWHALSNPEKTPEIDQVAYDQAMKTMELDGLHVTATEQQTQAYWSRERNKSKVDQASAKPATDFDEESKVLRAKVKSDERLPDTTTGGPSVSDLVPVALAAAPQKKRKRSRLVDLEQQEASSSRRDAASQRVHPPQTSSAYIHFPAHTSC